MEINWGNHNLPPDTEWRKADSTNAEYVIRDTELSIKAYFTLLF